MTALSPLAQRLVAIGLLVLAALLASAAAQALLAAPAEALADLDRARARSARLEAMVRRPSPPAAAAVPYDLYVRAATHETATALVATRIAAAAGAAGLAAPELRQGPRVAAVPNLLRVGLAVEGPEPAVLAFANDLERGAPAIRLRSWRLLHPAGGTPRLRLQATALAAWEGAP